MADRSLELALKIRADIEQASRAVASFGADIEKVGDKANKASDSLAKVDAAKIEEVGAASDQAAASIAETSKVAAEAEERYKRIAQEAIAYREALDAQVLASAETAAADTRSAEASQQLVTQWQRLQAADPYADAPQQIRALDDLNTRLEAGAANTEQLADTEQRLDRAYKAGLVTQEEYTDAQATLDKQEKALLATRAKEEAQLRSLLKAYDPANAALRKLTDDEAKLKKAVDEGTISREQYNRAMVGIASSRAQWELVNEGVEKTTNSMGELSLSAREVRSSLATAASQLAQGNVGGAGNALLSIGSRGALSFGALGLAIGGVVALLGAFTAASVQSYLQQQQFEATLISTGNQLGVNSSQLVDVATRAGTLTSEYGKAGAAVDALAGAGSVAVDLLQAASSVAVNLSELTGESIESTTQKIIKLAEAPSAQLAELNKQYSFLTLEVFDHVQSLEEQGRAEDAARVAIEAFASVHEQRVVEATERAGSLERAWKSVRTTVQDAWRAIQDIGRDDAEARIAAGERGIKLRLDQVVRNSQDMLRGFMSIDEANRRNAVLRQGIALEERNLAALRVQKATVDAGNKEKAEQQQIEDQAIAARQDISKKLEEGLDRQAKKQKALNTLVEQFNAIAIADAGDSRLFDGSYEKRKAQIEEQFKAPASRKTTVKQSDTEKADAAAERELANLEKQIALLGSLEDGETKATEAARLRYEVENGAYKVASQANKQKLLDRAAVLDALHAETEAEKQRAKEVEKTTRSYEQLKDALRTPAEVALETAIERVQVLNAALKQGVIDKAALDAAMGRVVEGALLDAPKFEGLAPEIAGPFGELSKIEEARKELQEWYDERLRMLEEFRISEAFTVEAFNAAAEETEAQHQARLRAIESAQTQVMLAGASAAFGQLADIAKAYGGEQSKTYRALFALSKAFAVAQAAVALAQNVSEASKVGFPQNVPLIAGAFAQGASIVALLAGANFSGGGGYAEGGYTGAGGKFEPAGVVHRGEGVLNQGEIRALGGPGGFYALRDAIASGALPRYAFATTPSLRPSPRYSFAEGGFAHDALPAQAQAPITIRPIVAIGEKELAEAMNSADGDRVLLTQARRLKGSLKQLLEIG